MRQRAGAAVQDQQHVAVACVCRRTCGLTMGTTCLGGTARPPARTGARGVSGWLAGRVGGWACLCAGFVLAGQLGPRKIKEVFRLTKCSFVRGLTSGEQKAHRLTLCPAVLIVGSAAPYDIPQFAKPSQPTLAPPRRAGVGSYERECRTLYIHYGGAGGTGRQLPACSIFKSPARSAAPRQALVACACSVRWLLQLALPWAGKHVSREA